MRLRSILPLGLLAVSAFALAVQAMDLKWTPKVGDKSTYKITGNFDLAGAGEITLAGTRSEEVKTVEADKIVVSGMTKMTVNAMGNEVPVPDSTETTTSKPDGTVLDVKIGGDAPGGNGLRLARLSSFIFPSKP